MPFEQFNLTKSVNQSRDIFDKYIYRSSSDTLSEIRANNYFAESRFLRDEPEAWKGAIIEVIGTDGYAVLQVSDDGLSVVEVGSGVAFALGPVDNIFGATSGDGAAVPLAVSPAANRAAAVTVRNNYFTANPANLAQYDAEPRIGIYLYFTSGSDTLIETQSRIGGEWRTRSGVVAVPGEPGQAGGIMSFKSIAARDTFFNQQSNRTAFLEAGLPIQVNSGEGTVFNQVWRGVDNPTTYNTVLWQTVSVETPAGSIVLGPDARFSAFGEELALSIASTSETKIAVKTILGTSGTGRPTEPGFGPVVDLIDRRGDANADSPTQAVHQYTIVTPSAGGNFTGKSTFDTAEIEFVSRPSLLLLEAWSGTGTSGPKIFEKLMDITGSGPGTYVLDLASESTLSPDQTITTRLTGDTAFSYRGVDISGQFILTSLSRGRVFNPKGIGYADEDITGAMFTGSQMTLNRVTGGNITASMPSAVPTPEGGGSGSAGSMSEAQATKLEGIEANATTDQTGAEIADLLDALTGDDRLQAMSVRTASSNVQAELDAITSNGRFRGNYSTTATYAHGDITRSNYQGRPAMYISAAAQLPDTTLPEAKLDTGFWFLVTDRTWRGTWVASDYIPGQIVSHGGELWTAVQIIPVTDTNAPSSSNSAWQQISGAGGSALLPTIYRRSSSAIDSDFLLKRVEFDGSSGAATFTAPTTSAAGFANGSNTFIENTHGSINLTLAAASGLTIDGPTTVAPGQLVKLIWEEVSGGNDILHVYWVNNGGAGGGANGPYNDYRTKTASATLLSTETGITAYTGTADATFTLPSGLGASDTWLSFIDNQSSAGMLTIAGGAATNVLESGQGSVIYWNGAAFIQGALKTRSNVAEFPDNVNSPIQPSTSYTANGATYTTGSSGITYGNSDARTVFLNSNLRMQTPSVYVHDLPELNLISDSEGLSITKNSTSADQLIRPFSGQIIVFGNTTFTFSNPLRLTSGRVTVVKSSSIQWIVTSLTGTFIGGTTSGGSGSSQSEQSGGVFFNETGSAVEIGDGVHLDGLDGNQSFSATGPGADGLLAGFAQEDIPADVSGQIGRDGPINVPKIRITNGIQIGAPLSTGDRIYWYPGGAGPTPGYLTLDEDSGANTQAMRVITSEWPYSTQDYTTNVVIDDQAEWDAAINKVHVKNLGSYITIELPDLAEGSSEATAIAGQRLIVHVPLGGGTTAIRPRGASTIAPKSGSGTTYTNATPLPMTGGATAEYTLIEVNAAANSYEYYELNTSGINTFGFFNAGDYYNRIAASAIFSLSTQVQTNTNAIAEFDNFFFRNITTTAPAEFNISNNFQAPQSFYNIDGGSANGDRIASISTTLSDWPDIANNGRAIMLRFYNPSAFTGIARLASGNFIGSGSGDATIPAAGGGKPGRLDILVYNDSGFKAAVM